MEEQFIRKEAIIPATREELWHAWTTTEGVESFFAPKAKIELKVGGAYECLFLLDRPHSDQGSEGCKVLAFWPMDYISFSWNAPPEFPEERGQHTKVVVEIDRHDESNYRVLLTHMGFGSSGNWDKVIQFFEVAWQNVLNNLKALFEAKRASEEPLNAER
ncbi:MAG TPA: SRPBCC domain-containing protein [Candidatus Kapabacteria bacterium]|nr:SRPBCC domain-containing protein [Candidatus Kapabacteria bacterium]